MANDPKIYTRSGDGGMTSLLSGERVPKHHPRPEACGTVDELSAALAVLCSVPGFEKTGAADRLRSIQRTLYRIGSVLAVSPGSERMQDLPGIVPGDWEALEEEMDRMNGELPPLSGFILPGGHPASAQAHVARTVCRRAERRVAALMHAGPSGDEAVRPVVVFLNRLADYLFVLARYGNHVHGVAP